MIYIFLAEGFEEIEALAPLDILRRAGVEVKTVSITDDYIVTGAHGIPVMADTTIFQTTDSVPGGWNDEQRLGECDMIVLPGGLPGSTNLDACQRLKEMIRVHYDAGRPLAAICAAPLVYGHMGILAAGERAVSTTNRNFVGRMGHIDSEVYLASPAVAAASAVTGYISNPEKV